MEGVSREIRLDARPTSDTGEELCEVAEATIPAHESTMIQTIGLGEPTASPLAYFAQEQNVEIWKPTQL